MEQFEQLLAVFSESAVSRDGSLTYEQLYKVLHTLNDTFTEDGVKQLCKQVDKDGDGRVDFRELLYYVMDWDTAIEQSLAHESGLSPSYVYCRIRPFAESGGHADGEAVEKSLDGWTDKSIFVKDRHARTEYTFPTAVVTPEKTQQETFDAVMPDLIDAWIMKVYNVMFLAYGQTGTGKTHTMFGPRESLSSAEPHADWGLFPRIVHTCLSRMNATVKMMPECKYILTASAVEFYMSTCYDLLSERAPLILDADGFPSGANVYRINTAADVAPYLDMVNSNKSVMKTKMNAGSSRSHCALILTLHQLDSGNKGQFAGQCCTTTFTMVDMAGSERVSKTGADFVAPSQVMGILASGKEPSKEQQMGIEGGMINFELMSIRDEVVKATEQHSKKKKYLPPKRMTTDTMRFMGTCFTGKALLGVIVCISQSPQNGWETWFSCTYGNDLAKLKAPLQKGKLKAYDKVLKDAKAAAARALKVFKDTPETGPAAKWRPLRKGQAHGTAELVKVLEALKTA